jgi:hypothetical protein
VNRAPGASRAIPAFLLLVAACGGGGSTRGEPSVPAAPPLHLAPTTDLAQAASIAWLVDLSPRALVAHAELLPAIETLLPHERVAGFTERNGFDPLALDELTLAAYSAAPNTQADSMLYLVRGGFVPSKLESIFRAQTGGIAGRATDHAGEQEILRAWGTMRGEPAQMATFGHEVAALEVGRPGPLRVAELFARERLKRASPALKSGSLARAAELVRDHQGRDPPARAFALGPFEGESAKALGGLIAASTAAALGAEPGIVAGQGAFRITLVLTGGWENDARVAADRLAAAFDALSATPLGRLAGLDHPLDLVHVEPLPDALRLTVALDALALARGARAAMGAEVIEIMSY